MGTSGIMLPPTVTDRHVRALRQMGNSGTWDSSELSRLYEGEHAPALWLCPDARLTMDCQNETNHFVASPTLACSGHPRLVCPFCLDAHRSPQLATENVFKSIAATAAKSKSPPKSRGALGSHDGSVLQQNIKGIVQRGLAASHLPALAGQSQRFAYTVRDGVSGGRVDFSPLDR